MLLKILAILVLHTLFSHHLLSASVSFVSSQNDNTTEHEHYFPIHWNKISHKDDRDVSEFSTGMSFSNM